MKTKLSVTVFKIRGNGECLSAKTLEKIYKEYIHLNEGDQIIIGGYNTICSKGFLNACVDIVWYSCGKIDIEEKYYDNAMADLKKTGWK